MHDTVSIYSAFLWVMTGSMLLIAIALAFAIAAWLRLPTARRSGVFGPLLAVPSVLLPLLAGASSDSAWEWTPGVQEFAMPVAVAVICAILFWRETRALRAVARADAGVIVHEAGRGTSSCAE